MKIVTSYSVRLRQAPTCLKDTLVKYREAVDWFIGIMDAEWNAYAECANNQMAVRVSEKLCVKTAKNESPKHAFSDSFYKFPSYLRRAAIAEAFGLVSSYHSGLDNWNDLPVSERGRRPSFPKAGFVYPAMYRGNCFVRTGTYSARIKVWTRNTWDWLDVKLRKGDVDYILRRCSSRKECVPTLRQRGKVWSLDFSFEESVALADPNDIETQRILSVDLGLNSACVCSVMTSDGTVVGRRFLHLPSEYDHLRHYIGHIKHAQQSGARRMPGLWAKAKGVNDDISVKILSTPPCFLESIPLSWRHWISTGKSVAPKSNDYPCGERDMCSQWSKLKLTVQVFGSVVSAHGIPAVWLSTVAAVSCGEEKQRRWGKHTLFANSRTEKSITAT